jgi:hypothetical protein
VSKRTQYRARKYGRTASDFGKKPVFKTKQPTVGSNGRMGFLRAHNLVP